MQWLRNDQTSKKLVTENPQIWGKINCTRTLIDDQLLQATKAKAGSDISESLWTKISTIYNHFLSYQMSSNMKIVLVSFKILKHIAKGFYSFMNWFLAVSGQTDALHENPSQITRFILVFKT